MEKVEKSFKKVKEDFNRLEYEISLLKEDLDDVKKLLSESYLALSRLNEAYIELKGIQTQKEQVKTERFENKTDTPVFRPLKGKILDISTGNGGVQTDRQTDRQTDERRVFQGENGEEKKAGSFEEVLEALNSLDGLKKEVRLKFKTLTPQELLVFSALYQIEEEKGFSDYKSLSQRVKLTESSIRDYIRRLILKGIPIEKLKENNKEVRLYISKALKNIASLDTILKLVDL